MPLFRREVRRKENVPVFRREENIRLKLAEIQKENNILLQRMRGIKFESKKIPQEKLIKDQQKVLLLMVRLDSGVEVSQMLDVRAINQIMYQLCDELEKAYLDGDELTAHYIMETLTYGIATGHRPLCDTEKGHEAEIMKKREKKMETYLRLTQAAQNVFQCTSSVDVQTAALKQNGKDLENLLKEIEMFAMESPANAAAMEMIEESGGKVADMADLHGPMLELAQKYKSCTDIYNECELRKKHVNLLNAEMDHYKALINEMEIILNLTNEVANTDIR